MTQFISRAYNTFEIDKRTDAVLIKRSTDVRLANELVYYSNLPAELAVYFPRIFYSNITDESIEMGMEYHAYDNLGNLMIRHPHDHETWDAVFSFVFKFLNNAQRHSSTVDGTNDCRLMYINKTEDEYKKLIDNFPYFRVFEDNETVTLNGIPLKTFPAIWPTIKAYIESNCLVDKLSYIHGDMCFSNILYGKNPINNTVVLKFIDPRGSFGNTMFYGDVYYDLAKLMHSCDGRYEYFISDEFAVTDNGTDFTLQFHKESPQLIKDTLDKLIKVNNFDSMKVELLQGLIFIGMCARHYDSHERQKGMFLTGLRILNKVYANLL